MIFMKLDNYEIEIFFFKMWNIWEHQFYSTQGERLRRKRQPDEASNRHFDLQDVGLARGLHIPSDATISRTWSLESPCRILPRFYVDYQSEKVLTRIWRAYISPRDQEPHGLILPWLYLVAVGRFRGIYYFHISTLTICFRRWEWKSPSSGRLHTDFTTFYLTIVCIPSFTTLYWSPC